MLPGIPHLEAVDLLHRLSANGQLIEPAHGALQLHEVQLVPQSQGVLDERTCEELRARYPQTRFRLHANVRVLDRHRFADLAGMRKHLDWFTRASEVHRALGATEYSAHAGARCDATMDELFDHAKRASDLFGCPVAIEGHYPTMDGRNRWLVSSWREYEELWRSGLPFALDLSHLNIVATAEGWVHLDLVVAMLLSPSCREVHLSANDGSGDQHRACESACWWTDVLREHLQATTTVFSEGRLERCKHAPALT